MLFPWSGSENFGFKVQRFKIFLIQAVKLTQFFILSKLLKLFSIFLKNVTEIRNKTASLFNTQLCIYLDEACIKSSLPENIIRKNLENKVLDPCFKGRQL